MDSKAREQIIKNDKNLDLSKIITNFVIVTTLLIQSMRQNQPISNAELAEMMHNAGLRPSAQRLAILRNIVEERAHPTADEIFCNLQIDYPTMSRTTVYNSLHALTEAGLLRELELESGNRRYDFAPQPRHGHLRCRRCGRIFDMALPPELCFPSADGFRIDSIDIFFKGLCPDCCDRESENNSNI